MNHQKKIKKKKKWTWLFRSYIENVIIIVYMLKLSIRNFDYNLLILSSSDLRFFHFNFYCIHVFMYMRHVIKSPLLHVHAKYKNDHQFF